MTPTKAYTKEGDYPWQWVEDDGTSNGQGRGDSGWYWYDGLGTRANGTTTGISMLTTTNPALTAALRSSRCPWQSDTD